MSCKTRPLAKALASAKVFVDGDWVESKDQDPDGDVRLIQLADVGDGYYVDKSNRFLTSSAAERLKCTFLEPGDVLIARMPDPLGRACIFPGDQKRAVTVVDVCIIRVDPERMYAPWLVHCINSSITRNKIAGYVTGTTRQRISRGNLGKVEIAVPPVTEQRRIAAILDQADALRAKRREALAQLDNLTQSIFIEMFGDPATNPRSWPWKTLGSIALKFSDGPFGSNLKSEHYVDVGIRVVRLQNIGVGEFVDKDKAYISEHHFASIKKHECLPGDVLVGTMGEPNLRACILPKQIPLAINKADCVQIRVDPKLANSSFICGLINHPSTELLAQDLKHGQTRVRISMGSLRGLEVPIPPVSLQSLFAERMKAVELLRTTHLDSLGELDALFASLQHRAFRGEL